MAALYETGFKRPVDTLTISEKDTLVEMLKVHVLIKVKGETDQFVDGLRICGVLGAVQDHPQLMSRFFLHSPTKLTAGKFF